MRFALFFIILFSANSYAKEKYFYDAKTQNCKNSRGELGRNPNTLGECGEYTDRDLSGQDLTGYNLRGAKLNGTNFQQAILNYADFTGSQLHLTNFRMAQLNGAILMNVWMYNTCPMQPDGTYRCGPKFINASMIGADLRGFRYNWGPDFTGANLTDAILGDADYPICLRFIPSYPKFDQARLCGAVVLNMWNTGICKPGSLTGSIFDDATQLDFSREQALDYGMVYEKNCRN